MTATITTTTVIGQVPAWILREFDAYYSEFLNLAFLAKSAFEERDPGRSVALSKRRLSIFSESIARLGSELKKVFPLLAQDEEFWREVEIPYLSLVRGRYEADLASAYIHSIRRKLLRGEWKPVEYAFSAASNANPDVGPQVFRRFAGGGQVSPETIAEIFDIPKFSRPYSALAEDARLVAERLNQDLGLAGKGSGRIEKIDVVNGGFYRNRGAYIVGRLALNDGNFIPFIIALLNGEKGIYADAVLTFDTTVYNLFSSTLANFHVTNKYYHELCAFLHSIIPRRPLGLHYSAIGYNHLGKVAVMDELKKELATAGQVFETAVGFRGTVTIGFAAADSSYSLKVIRDKPTAQYKWGKFDGIDAVLEKYHRVHEINRAGSMLDNIIYYNLKLEQILFETSLLEELLSEARQSVSLERGYVIFKHLIVQRKIIPIPVFLETASRVEARKAIINLGYCIKNNAAANVFNKDLDARNYGVSRYRKVYLFDYDAVEPLTEIKIRTNRERVEGEDDVPYWYYEDGVTFLPEEIEIGLRITDPSLRLLFRHIHGDLTTTEYWERIQMDLRQEKVPPLHLYPEACRLRKIR